MPRQALSVTLQTENITWLKARSGAGQARSLSELLDRLVTAARQAGHAGQARSVVGTIDVDAADPNLEGADASVRSLFEASLSRPLVVREKRATHRTRTMAMKRRG
jgi:hypothetical protein